MITKNELKVGQVYESNDDEDIFFVPFFIKDDYVHYASFDKSGPYYLYSTFHEDSSEYLLRLGTLREDLEARTTAMLIEGKEIWPTNSLYTLEKAKNVFRSNLFRWPSGPEDIVIFEKKEVGG